ncbi:L-2-hydroxyglutarate oxidase [Rhodocaloribacter litoris]|uniref:L-2-hydroxyglutarate oxidase n=1 Tax=Rhodocaloribacter litoris TaxID=2558931 RepID=UPI001422AC9B|nr:L-2-hydroxyglutarate oxidase [Rhodocaloribacter litoris]QXD13833.1 L-2-hydroxyglutarate oxidase [Rhodocaloribacter litoris]
MTHDVAIVGGGIVGLATAYQLARQAPGRSIIVLEKEAALATHQTGRNSGVIHSGIYYRPGSLKAENCREGRKALVAFCEREGLPFEVCGKVIVAVTEAERPRLHAILERGRANGIAARLIGPEALRAREPHVRGVEAILVPEAGIVDFRAVTLRLAERVRERGHEVRTNAAVRDVAVRSDGFTLATEAGEVRARYLVGCAGLYADRLARMCGLEPGVRIIPFRGEYFELKPPARALCRHLIYPVPDPAFPFLGVHFTRMIDGRVECGPSAVLAFAREGYTFGTVNLRDLAEMVTYPGFRRLAARHARTGWHELRQSLSKRVYLRALRRLIPDVTLDDLAPRVAGVRAQAVRPDGTLVDDFLFAETDRAVHVCNAPSPAATAALNVGRLAAERLLAHLA